MAAVRVFLGNAPWFRPGHYGVRAGSRWPHFERNEDCYVPFPFFLAHAASLLNKNDIDTFVLDAVPLRMKEPEFLEKALEYNPEIIVLEVSTASFDIDFAIAEKLKKNNPQAVIVFCGPHKMMYSEAFIHHQNIVDVVMVGEYEFTLLEYVKAFQSDKNYSAVAGLIYRDGDQVKKTPDRPLLSDINQIPWPERDSLPMVKYADPFCDVPLPSLQMWASRGCPFHCKFCFWPQVMYGSHKYRVRNTKDVLDEVEHCVKTGKYRSVYFDDDTFNIGKERIMELAQGFIDRKINIPWAIMCRADLMDREMLEKLKESGVVAVKYGVESGNQDIVNNCGKDLDLEKVREVCKITRELGIRMHLTFTFGLPGETWETAMSSIEFAIELDPYSIQFSIVTPFPGSKFFDEMKEQGALISTDWQDYDGHSKAVIKTATLDPEDLEEIQSMAWDMWHKHKHNQGKNDRFKQNKTQYAVKAICHPFWAISKIKEGLAFSKLKKKVSSSKNKSR